MSQLADLAAEMRTILAPYDKGFIHRILFGGLHVIMERRGQQWRLAIARTQGKVPSATEVAVVARDFAVPAGTEWSRTITKKKNSKLRHGKIVTATEIYSVAECTWREEAKEATPC